MQSNGIKLGTLIYVMRGNEQDPDSIEILLLHRNKRQKDMHAGKWVGIGGKLLERESPRECAIRELKEEANIIPLDLTFRGQVYFDEIHKNGRNDHSGDAFNWIVFLYKVTKFVGEINKECHEGTLKWVQLKDLDSLPMWKGDHALIPAVILSKRTIDAKMVYEGEEVVQLWLFDNTRPWTNTEECHEQTKE